MSKVGSITFGGNKLVRSRINNIIRTNDKIEGKVLYILIGISCLITSIFIIWGYRATIHSDTATANLLSNEIINSGQLLPSGWNYVQDIWILFIQIFVLPFSAIFNNEVLVRGLGVMLQTVMLIILINKIFDKMNIHYGKLLVLGIWLSGTSSVVLEYVYAQAVYGTIILIFMMVLYIIWVLLDNRIEKKKFRINIGVLSLLLIIINLSTTRYLGTFIVGIIMTLVIIQLIEYLIKESLTVPLKTQAIILSSIGISSLIGILGFLILKAYVSFNPGIANPIFVDYSTINNNIFNVLNSWLNIYGAYGNANTNVLSIDGIFNSYRFVFAIFTTIVVPSILLIRYKQLETIYEKFILVFYVVNSTINIYILLATNVAYDIEGASRYLLFNFFINIILLGIFYEQIIRSNKKLLSYLVILSIVPICISSFYAQIKLEFSLHEGKLKFGKHINDDLIDFLKVNELEFGYATYWNSYVNTMISNGEVEIIGVIPTSNLAPFYHLNSSRWYEEQYHEGATRCDVKSIA